MCHQTPHGTAVEHLCPGLLVCTSGGLLLQFAPSGSRAGVKTAGCIPHPSLPAGQWRAKSRQAARSSIPTRLQVYDTPPSSRPLPPALIHLMHGHQEGGSNWGCFSLFSGIKHHVSLTWSSWPCINRAGCSPLPICQSAIIGTSVLYIQCAGQTDRPPEQNGQCLPLGRCVQSCLSQTGSPGNPAANFLISSNCLITSKATSKRLDSAAIMAETWTTVPL